MNSIVPWSRVLLGEVCEFKYGKSLPEHKRVSGPYLVYGSNGPVGTHLEALTYGPTIVVGRKGSFGEVHYSDAGCWPIDTTYYIDSTSTSCDLKWLTYRLNSLGLKKLNRAAAVPGLNRDDAYRQEFLLPPLDEQRQIAQVLDSVDALRAKRRKAIALLGDLAQSILHGMFGDPVRNPMDWPVVKLGAIGDVQGGLQLSATRSKNPIEIDYLRVANVHRSRLELSEIKSLRATKTEVERTLLMQDDLLIVEGHGNPNEIGRVAIWDGSIDPCVHQNHLIRVRLNSIETSPKYVESLINSPGGRRYLIRSARTTSGLNTIGVSHVKAVPIPIPPAHLQRIYVDRTVKIEKLKATHLAHLAELDVLFASLQDRAFRGELTASSFA